MVFKGGGRKYFSSVFFTNFARTVNNCGGTSLSGEDEFSQILAFHEKQSETV